MMNLPQKILSALAILAVTSSVSTLAHATVIDFESLALNNNAVNNTGSPYSEDGFSIAATTLSFFGTLENRFTGSTALLNRIGKGVTILTNDMANPFSVQSIDLSELNGNRVADVNFTGQVSGAGTVMQTFTLDGVFGNETFLFNASFANLTSLSWVQISPFHQFDNIVLNEGGGVSPVPLPAALPLMAAGLGLMGFVGRRKKQAA